MVSLPELEKMSDIEIVDYVLIMAHEDGSAESEYVYKRMTNMIVVPFLGVETSIQD